MTWRKIKTLTDPNAITKLEEAYQIRLPDDLKRCIVANNGARPVPDVVTTASGSQFDVKLLLSYNPDDKETVYHVMDHFHSLGLIPFAVDSGGNYYCVAKDEQIVLIIENDSILPLCDSFSAFLEMLHPLETARK